MDESGIEAWKRENFDRWVACVAWEMGYSVKVIRNEVLTRASERLGEGGSLVPLYAESSIRGWLRSAGYEARRKPVSDQEIDGWLERFSAGETCGEIALEVGRDRTVISKALVARGVVMSRGRRAGARA